MPHLVRVSMAAGLLLANVACSSLVAEDPRFTGDITRNTFAALRQEAIPEVRQEAAEMPSQVAAFETPRDGTDAPAQGLAGRDGVIEEILEESGDAAFVLRSPRSRHRAATTAGVAAPSTPGQYPDYLASMNRVLDRQNETARRAVRSMCGGC